MPWVPVAAASAVPPGVARGTPPARILLPHLHPIPQPDLLVAARPMADAAVHGAVSFQAHGTPEALGFALPLPSATTRATLLPRRTAWADMVSDDSESDSQPEWGNATAARGMDASGRTKEDLEHVDAPSCNGPNAGGDFVAVAASNANPTTSPEQWASKVQDMAECLKNLVVSAPSRGPATRSIEVATSADAHCVCRWQHVMRLLRREQAELELARVQAEGALAEAQNAEQQSLEARIPLHDAALRLALTTETIVSERRDDHQRSMVVVARAATLLRSVQDSALSMTQRVGRSVLDGRDMLASLRAEAARCTCAAQEARAGASRLASLRKSTETVPNLAQRRRVGETRVAHFGEHLACLKRSINQVQAELSAVPAAAGTRAEALMARAAQLERECQRLHTPEGATRAEGHRTAEQRQDSAELRNAQESNARLASDVRQARAERDQACAGLEAVQVGVAAMREQCLQDQAALADLELQRKDITKKEDSARKEVASWHEQIGAFERQIQAAEEAAKEAREHHAELEAEGRGLVLARRRAEEEATVLEWRLQKALAQLDRERPGAPLARLLQPRPQGPAGALGPLCRAPRAKGLGSRGWTGRGQPGGSEADAESTTAGESAAEGLAAEDAAADGPP